MGTKCNYDSDCVDPTPRCDYVCRRNDGKCDNAEDCVGSFVCIGKTSESLGICEPQEDVHKEINHRTQGCQNSKNPFVHNYFCRDACVDLYNQRANNNTACDEWKCDSYDPLSPDEASCNSFDGTKPRWGGV